MGVTGAPRGDGGGARARQAGPVREAARRRPVRGSLDDRGGHRGRRPGRHAASTTASSRRCASPATSSLSGALGEIVQFRAAYLQDYAAGPAPLRPHNGSRAVTDYAHIVDFLRYLGCEARGGPGDDREADRRSGRTSRTPTSRRSTCAAAGSARSRRRGSPAAGRAGRSSRSTGPHGSLWWDMEDLNRLHVFYARGRGGRDRRVPGRARDPARPPVRSPSGGRPVTRIGWEQQLRPRVARLPGGGHRGPTRAGPPGDLRGRLPGRRPVRRDPGLGARGSAGLDRRDDADRAVASAR